MAFMVQGVIIFGFQGQVIDLFGELLIGVNVFVVYQFFGMIYGVVINVNGLYCIFSMCVGGFYLIKIIYMGYQELVKENVYLFFGQIFQFNVVLQEIVYEIDGIEVVVNCNDIFDGNVDG